MEMHVLVFGQLTDITGTGTIKVPEVKDTDQLLDQLREKYPALKDVKFLVAVDKKAVHTNTPVSSASTIVLMPPFSGG